MKAGFKSKLLLLVALNLFLTVGSPTPTLAMTRDSLISPLYFQDIDTIVLVNNFGPGAKEILGMEDVELQSWIDSSFKAMFPSQPGILIGPRYGEHALPPDDKVKKSSIELVFILSAREETVNGGPVKTAALSVQFLRSMFYNEPRGISPDAVTYPFSVPESKDELKIKIQDGVRYLTSYVPSYFCKKVESSTVSCSHYPPYEEKLPSAIAPSEGRKP